jgi:myo-inositol-1(or 4)-monophosphatase
MAGTAESDDSIEVLADFAARLAFDAGQLLTTIQRSGDLRVREKRNAGDLLTVGDTQAQDSIVGAIKARFPDHSVISEELPEGAEVNESAGVVWTIDPVDGTTNFATMSGDYAVSIGVEVRGSARAGVIYQPWANSMYTAISGGGAFHNGRRVRTAANDLDRAIVSIEGSSAPEVRVRQSQLMAELLPKARDVRRIGSCCLSLAAIAEGRFDALICNGAGPWDWAAGQVIVEEAGGWVGSPEGGRPDSTEFVAVSGHLRQQLRETVYGKSARA